ncbi:hypothetical protein HanXRQr2_Chr15g0684321 [Helianthus annuus]|uniref:Uncharacterized protein n=1 Tax=Helianthus annuus TaxID=4232 RepID=A0A9K3DZ18_HELAN|nr:hypothetical protein HanXRQr2_Chr15g0684321 [Helianthus annuus]
MVFNTGTEFPVPNYFWYRLGTHFLKFPVPVLSVYYRFGTVPISYRFLPSNTGTVQHFQYRYPLLAIFGTGIFSAITMLIPSLKSKCVMLLVGRPIPSMRSRNVEKKNIIRI